ncbi:MAG: transporter substrate-binding domain-containing protein [Puniceicoccales bacterium]
MCQIRAIRRFSLLDEQAFLSHNFLNVKYLIIFSLLPLLAALSLRAADQPKFTIGIKETPPFTLKDDEGQWSGPTVWLIEEILLQMGRTPEFKEMTLTEIFEQLKNSQIDAGIAALSITSDREEVIDFTHSFFESGIGIAVRDGDTEMWILVLKNIFSIRFMQVVFSLLLLLTVVGLFVWLAERKHNPEEFGGRPGKGIGAGLWWSAVTMTTVGYGDKAPKTLLGRVVGLIWMFLAIIIISGFTAGFASSLTRDSLSHKVEDLRDLHDVSTATVKGSTSASWLSALKIPYRTSDSIEELLVQLDEGKWEAVVFDKPVLDYYVTKDELSHVDILKVTFTRENYGIALPPDSPYREQIDVLLLKLTQTQEWQEQLNDVMSHEN